MAIRYDVADKVAGVNKRFGVILSTVAFACGWMYGRRGLGLRSVLSIGTGGLLWATAGFG
jgi:hypothetical protein